nr:recombinase family protein [Streptomyces sp. AcE210]
MNLIRPLPHRPAALEAAGCVGVFTDMKSGKNAEREELWKCLDYLRPGDTLVAPSLDRLGRSIQDLISIVAGLRKRGTGFQRAPARNPGGFHPGGIAPGGGNAEHRRGNGPGAHARNRAGAPGEEGALFECRYVSRQVTSRP